MVRTPPGRKQPRSVVITLWIGLLVMALLEIGSLLYALIR